MSARKVIPIDATLTRMDAGQRQRALSLQRISRRPDLVPRRLTIALGLTIGAALLVNWVWGY